MSEISTDGTRESTEIPRCEYPECTRARMMKVRDRLSLCDEHYNLWKFIENLLFEATIEITTRESRFQE